jgi:hypothetical protein
LAHGDARRALGRLVAPRFPDMRIVFAVYDRL